MPMAVPRDVVSLSMASISRSVSVVGGTTSPANPAKATIPMRVPSSWLRMNVRAASWATTRRFGATSVEHIERETSMASSTDVALRATVTWAVGRPAANPSPTRPATSRASGTRRFQWARGGTAARTSGDVGHPHGHPAAPPPAGPEHGRAAPARRASASSAHGQANDIRRPARTSAASARRRRASRATAARAKSAVISVVSSTDVTRRSRDSVIGSTPGRLVRRRVGAAGDRRPGRAGPARRAPSPPGSRRRSIVVPSAVPTPIADTWTPASAASWATAVGSGPPVSSPSDTRRIDADGK